MALLDPNTLVGILHGKLGNLVVARMKDGRIVVRRPPVRKARCTEGERVGQSRLAASNRYIQNPSKRRLLCM